MVCERLCEAVEWAALAGCSVHYEVWLVVRDSVGRDQDWDRAG